MPEQEETKPNKDVILVLDTSLSMVGKAPNSRDIMPQVKQSLDRFVSSLERDDTFTFITFDTIVEVYPTIRVSDESDKDVVKKYVSMVDAEGQWTYTMEMFRNVLLIADDIEQKNKINDAEERKEVIIILTDALDDPPPADRDKQLDINSLAGQHSGEDWYIYFINLGELASNEKIQQLREDLKEISERAEVYTPEDVDQSLNEDIDRAIGQETRQALKPQVPIYQSPWFYLVLVLLVLIVIMIIYMQYMSKLKLSGALEYKNSAVIGATFDKANLTRFDSRRIAIGKDSLCEIRIADFESNRPIVLEAAMIKGEVHVFINSERGLRVSIIEGQSEPYLEDNTRFSAGGYEFIYHAEK